MNDKLIIKPPPIEKDCIRVTITIETTDRKRSISFDAANDSFYLADRELIIETTTGLALEVYETFLGD